MPERFVYDGDILRRDSGDYTPSAFLRRASSSDQSSSAGSPKPTIGEVYAYGRRDSLTRARFLLVRTSCEGSKQAYSRITLPGGSDVAHLKSTVERALRSPFKCTHVYTLPDRVLVENDSQILNFEDCQKVEAIFGQKEPLNQVTKKAGLKNMAEKTGETADHVVEIPYNDEKHADHDEIPVEDKNGFPQPIAVENYSQSSEKEEPSSNEVVPEEVKEEVKPQTPEPAEVKIESNQPTPIVEVKSPAKPHLSVDSENGDHEFVKISAEDADEKEGTANGEAKENTPVSKPASTPIIPPSSLTHEKKKEPKVADVIEEEKTPKEGGEVFKSTYIIPIAIGAAITLAVLIAVARSSSH